MSYNTPAAFKQALEARHKREAQARQQPLNRLRQLYIFERFMVRLLDVFGDDIILKGGLVLELRLERARTTKDIDLRLAGSGQDLFGRLKSAGQLDKGDYLRFELQPTRAIEGDGVVYGGQRFKVKGFLANKIYGDPFDLDIAPR